jgi:tetratricopeptide (TPR) repeat protein
MDTLAGTYAALGRHAEARKLHEETLALMEARLGPDHPVTLTIMYGLACDYIALGRHADAFSLIEEKVAKAKPGLEHRQTAEILNYVLRKYAWLLTTCPDRKLRDPKRAVALATKIVELVPKDGSFWNSLGVAHYRAGDWKAAVESFNKSIELRQDADNDWIFFYLAMAHQQLGKKEEARKWYDKGVAWMDKNSPNDEGLRGLRSQAEELLGMKKK